MKPIISIENLSKRYRIGGLHPGYMTFREMFAGVLAAPLKRAWKRDGLSTEEIIWALRDVNLEVQPGELVGIVGRNGAGKSTLLKILSRITRPTKGRVAIYGRVGSLLEVGTGFHPDLTGRENIYLSGAILGMRRFEIERKFDEIVAFSEIEKFINTPVKWYSSGMYVRLAFSVAAHLEPEILMMDEVLAVGDASFQQKCLDKMREIRRQGRTIFFVSHNMTAITRLCKRAILLDEGSILRDGPAQEVVNEYLSASWAIAAAREWSDPQTAPGDDVARLSRARLRTEAGETAQTFDLRQAVGIEIGFEVLRSGYALAPAIEIFNEEGTLIFSAEEAGAEWSGRERPAGAYVSTAWIPANFLSESTLRAHISLVSHAPSPVFHARAENALAFQVVDRQGADAARGAALITRPGLVRPELRWTD